jgi:hypothetical protein
VFTKEALEQKLAKWRRDNPTWQADPLAAHPEKDVLNMLIHLVDDIGPGNNGLASSYIRGAIQHLENLHREFFGS